MLGLPLRGSWLPSLRDRESEEGLSSHCEPHLQELQELQRFLMAQKAGLIANTNFVNVPDCK